MSDPINPSHYSEGWSNGAEVIDISEHLTSNGGQALQYIARATHQNESLRKHDSVEGWVEDLRKAVWFIEREINRLSMGPGGFLDHIGEIIEAQPEEWESSPDAFEAGLTSVISLNGMRRALGIPRQWDRLEDIPDGVTVTDNEGDFWKRRGDDVLMWLSNKIEADAWTIEPLKWETYSETFGPFTEVKESA